MSAKFESHWFFKVVKCELLFQEDINRPKMAAVKYLKDDASEKVKQNFRAEAETLSSFHHENIVRLFGICIDNKGPACMILGR